MSFSCIRCKSNIKTCCAIQFLQTLLLSTYRFILIQQKKNQEVSENLGCFFFKKDEHTPT